MKLVPSLSCCQSEFQLKAANGTLAGIVLICAFFQPIEDDDFEAEDESGRDLSDLPPEVALAVLSHLNATDLCLAACVWQQLASDEILWNSNNFEAPFVI